MQWWKNDHIYYFKIKFDSGQAMSANLEIFQLGNIIIIYKHKVPKFSNNKYKF